MTLFNFCMLIIFLTGLPKLELSRFFLFLNYEKDFQSFSEGERGVCSVHFLLRYCSTLHPAFSLTI